VRFAGEHHIAYGYDRPVFLEPHTLRLRPRSDPMQEVVRFELRMSPHPDGSAEGVDAFGNATALAWFSGEHERLVIETSFEVETRNGNPFDFILPEPELGRLPLRYPADLSPVLAPYLVTSGGDDAVAQLAGDANRDAGGELLPFLSGLTAMLHDRCEVIVRPDGDAWPPLRTLEEAKGSCRDLAVLQIEACRRQGVAARFVSGYQSATEQKEHELHAWAAAYIPGIGWRGYDPTHGLAVAGHHITLAAAPSPSGAAPTSGTFRGTGATSSMTADVRLRVSERPGG
jgi:transglutaminase-like putative cysteine protease